MAQGGYSRLQRRMRTAAGLPARVVGVEDRQSALETEIGAHIAEMRHELAELRSLLAGRLDADGEATELVGRLLQSSEARLAALEDRVGELEDNRAGR